VHYGPAVVAAGSLYSACCRLSAHEGAADSVLKSTLFGMEEYFTAEQQVGPAPFHHVPRSGFAYFAVVRGPLLPTGLADSPLVARAPPSQALLRPCIAQIDSLYLSYYVDPPPPIGHAGAASPSVSQSPVGAQEAIFAALVPARGA